VNANSAPPASPSVSLTLTLALADEAATVRLGAALAAALVAPAFIPASTPSLSSFTLHLQGDLGTGKTTLARALLRALGVTGRIKSPTYTLVELYNISRYDVQHFDLYRISDPREWHDAGFDEYLSQPSLKLIEWPEKAAGALPPPDIEIQLQHVNDSRHATLISRSETGQRCLDLLKI
jgi:tRNA threonylcarbamoyladenosine biosynthesis protein TsaE